MRKGTTGMLVLALVVGWGLGRYSLERGTPPGDRAGTGTPAMPSVPVDAIPAAAPTTVSSADPGDDLARLLRSGAYGPAVEQFERLQARGDDASVQAARQTLLDGARRLLSRGDYSASMQLLQRYLQADFRDVEARILLAEVYRGRHEFRAAIDQLYRARGQAWRPQMLERVTRRIRALVAGYANSLKRSGDDDALLELYQELTQLEPSHAPYFIGLGTAQLALKNDEAARQSLLLVVQDPQVGARARELLGRMSSAAGPEPTPAGQPQAAAPIVPVAGIPLLRSGSHFLVEARAGGAQPARLLIDTGASLTILTPEALKRKAVGARATGRTGTFTTANGRVRAPLYRLDSLVVGDWQVTDLEVGVLELGEQGVDGLLGMNFLRHFRFFIDQDAARLRLSVAAQSQ